jgi:hypothetical protein
MVELDGVSGAWTLSGVSANNTNATGQSASSSGIRINNTSGSVTFVDNDVTPDPFENNSFQTTGAKAFDATNAQAVSGKVATRVVTSATGGVSLSNVSANAGVGLTIATQVTTTGGTGFSAVSSGPITIVSSGANNSITSSGGRALVIQNTTIASGNATFAKISASGGDIGILLDNTGNVGHLTVSASGAGTCTNGGEAAGCVSGVITGQTGADSASATPGGTGIVLNNTMAPSFSRIWVHDTSNYGIRGTNVAGLTLSNSVLNGNNGDSTVDDDSTAFFNQLSGTVTISSTYFAGGCTNNLWVDNTSGGATVSLTNSTLGSSAGTCGGVQRPSNDAANFEAEPGAAGLSLTVDSTTFQSAAGDLLSYIAQGSLSGSLAVTGSTFSNSHPAIATGGGGLSITSGVATTMNFDTNTFRDAVGAGLLIVKLTGSSTQSGTFSNNTIGVSGTANSGSAEGSALKLQTAGGGTDSWTVSNNQIYGYNNFGVEVLAGGGATAQSGAINTTITGNTIAEPGTTIGTQDIPKNGVQLNIGTVAAPPPGDTFQACATISGNTLDQSGKDAVTTPTGQVIDVRLRQRQGTTIRLPGYGGANNDNTAVQNYIDTLNAGTVTVLAGNTVPTGGGFVGGAACPTS